MKTTRQELIAELRRVLKQKSQLYVCEKNSWWMPTAYVRKKTIRAVIRELEKK